MLPYVVICFAFLVLLYFYYVSKRTFDYWKEKHVVFAEPSLFFGNVKDIVLSRETSSHAILRLYKQFPKEPFVGFFFTKKPMLLLRDPELIKQVLVKDFQHFPNRGIVSNQTLDPLSSNLFNIEGQKWHDLRHKLTPTFTPAKLKSMFKSLAECGEEFNEHLGEIAQKQNVFDVIDLCSNFTIQVIGSCVFGIQINSIKEPDSEFKRMGEKVFQQTFKVFMKRNIRLIAPSIYRKLNMKVIPKDVETFFLKLVKDMIHQRETDGIKREDFLQIMLELKEQEANGLNKEKNLNFVMDDNLLTAQMFAFFVAGFETSSTTMSCCLYELALNPDVQECVRKEIGDTLAKHNQKLTYDAVFSMEYLDQVINETMRKHSTVGNLIRTCDIPYTIPGTDIKLKRGDTIMIPVFSLHHDPKYFPNPNKFNPKRFSKESKETRPQCSYMPFGDGPRICIGLRFARLQMMVGLIYLLKDFQLSPCAETEIPLTYNPKDLVLRPKSVRLEIKRIVNI